MSNESVKTILTALEQRGEVRPEGKGWRTRCPNPDHADVHPSFFLYPGGGGRCFSQCARYWSPKELAELLEIKLPQEKPGLMLAELARAKGLPEDFLHSQGVSDGIAGSGKSRTLCVDIPYTDERGDAVAVHKRLRLEGNPRFIKNSTGYPPASWREESGSSCGDVSRYLAVYRISESRGDLLSTTTHVRDSLRCPSAC